VAEGFARNMREWAQNDFVILGPKEDPARIRGLRDGAAALRRIANARSPYVDFQNSGPRDVAGGVLGKSAIHPDGEWVLRTQSESSEEAVGFAADKKAYLILSRVPKLPGELEILVQGDPVMRRPFVIVEAEPNRFPNTNARGAEALAAFL